MERRVRETAQRGRPRQTSVLNRCRACGGNVLTNFLNLGAQPIAHALLDEHQLAKPEPTFPLQLVFCHGCSLVQATETVEREVLFGSARPGRASFSATSSTLSRDYARQILAERPLDSDSFVVEVASGDGHLLSNFVEMDVPVLGIDPDEGAVVAARKRGVATRQEHFDSGLARELAKAGFKADIIIASKVAAHVGTISDFVEGLGILLKDDGEVLLEVTYVRDMIEKCEFDMVDHEHVFYWSVTAMERLLSRHGLYVNDAKRLAFNGDAVRLRASKKPDRSRRLSRLLAEEATLGLCELEYYLKFADEVVKTSVRLRKAVQLVHKGGGRLVAYGASARGATLLNYMNFPRGQIEYVVDRDPAKIGKFMPGVHLPIRPVETLISDRPDYVLMLAWNFAAEIVDQNQDYLLQGGRFILPHPDTAEVLPAPPAHVMPSEQLALP